MNLQISKWGNSLAMRIPSDLARRFGLREGDRVQAQVTSDGGLAIRPHGWSRHAFAAELSTARDAMPQGASVTDELRTAARY